MGGANIGAAAATNKNKPKSANPAKDIGLVTKLHLQSCSTSK